MPTLKEQLDKLTHLKHRLAVWEAIYQNLDDSFITREGRAAQRAIKVPGCIVEIVPEDIIEETLQYIGDGPIQELKNQIKLIEQQEIPTN